MVANYERVRTAIEAVFPTFEDFNPDAAIATVTSRQPCEIH
jgi:hypothetical protein